MTKRPENAAEGEKYQKYGSEIEDRRRCNIQTTLRNNPNVI